MKIRIGVLMLLMSTLACGGVNMDHIAQSLCIYQGGNWVDGRCLYPTTPPPAPDPTPTPTPTPPPDPPDPDPPVPPLPPVDPCPFGTPTAREMAARGKRVEIRPDLEGYNVTATPQANFGIEYYCQPGLWPEACRGNRTFGPVAPDGHPKRMACEAQFMEAPCPYFKTKPSPGYGLMTFDPYFVIDRVNQNHPNNKTCGEDDWVKVPNGHNLGIVAGSWWLASAHGRGYVIACNADQSVCTQSKWQVDH